MDVIDRLASEKEEMMRTIQALQSNQTDEMLTSSVASRHNVNPNEPEQMPPPKYSKEIDTEEYTWNPKSKETDKLSASEASRIFSSSPSRSRGRTMTRGGISRSASGSRDPRDLRGFGGSPGSPAGIIRSKSFDGPRRANSAPRVRTSGGMGISYELQADYDR